MKRIALFLCSLSWLPAAPVLLEGALAGPDELATSVFSAVAASQMSIQSYSYGGGVSATGAVIAAGGFDLSVYLFAGTGAGAVLVDQNDDGACPPGQTDATTGGCLDVTLAGVLAPGDYTLVLAAYGNTPAGTTLGDGFTGGGSFTDVFGSDRNALYAVDLTLTPIDVTTGVPEPGAASLALLGLAVLTWRVGGHGPLARAHIQPRAK